MFDTAEVVVTKPYLDRVIDSKTDGVPAVCGKQHQVSVPLAIACGYCEDYDDMRQQMAAGKRIKIRGKDCPVCLEARSRPAGRTRGL